MARGFLRHPNVLKYTADDESNFDRTIACELTNPKKLNLSIKLPFEKEVWRDGKCWMALVQSMLERTVESEACFLNANKLDAKRHI